MFTGLVLAIGRVSESAIIDGGLELRVAMAWDDLQLGESIAVDGACLTVERHGAGWFEVHVIATSLDRTMFGGYQAGRRVNLERALKIGDRLGGHLVQGHVDGVGQVERVAEQGDAWLVEIRVPEVVAQVSIPLGSITVDGVSLTVNAVPRRGIVQLSLIPFTFRHTTLGEKAPGDGVHLEGDTSGKYVEQLIRTGPRSGQV